MPTKLVSEETMPSRRSAVDHVPVSGAEMGNAVKAWFDTTPETVIILLQSDYLPAGNI